MATISIILKGQLSSPPYFYRKFSIKKKNNSERILYEPLPSLKEIQNWILNEILYKCKVSRYAKAYVPKRSIKEHTIYHTDEKMVLTLDIKNFFNSIRFSDVEKMFIEIGYSKRISNLLTKLCFLNGELPQGASTSPYISNLILLQFDKNVSDYCMVNKLKYTRYADDLAFSGLLNPKEIETLVKKNLSDLGLELNEAKTKLMKPNDPQIISGIIVNKKPQIPKRTRNKLRNEMFYIKKFGLADHMAKTNQTKANYLKHLMGKINYLIQINPRDKEFNEYYSYLRTLDKASR
nr:reverse transcriptase family protein [Nonlabens ulvanivorans]